MVDSLNNKTVNHKRSIYYGKKHIYNDIDNDNIKSV